MRALDTGEEYHLAWDRLVLSPGAAPIIPDLPGIGRLLTLRTVPDAERITAALADDRPLSPLLPHAGIDRTGKRLSQTVSLPARRGGRTSRPIRD